MRIVWPHEFFRIDFDQIIEEARRQEEIDVANTGELAVAHGIHSYFNDEVMPLVMTDDWVFDATRKFAIDYTAHWFIYLRSGGKQVFETQTKLEQLKEEIVDFLARAAVTGAAPRADQVDLVLASEFIRLVKLDRLNNKMRFEAKRLEKRAKDHEMLQLDITLRALRDHYVEVLPRLFYILRRVIKVDRNLRKNKGDDKLLDVSASLDFYERNVAADHPLYPVVGTLRGFYRIARNAKSHPEGMAWDSKSKQVILFDTGQPHRFGLHEFQQRYRYLAVYLCDLGLRGILSAFCEREKGPVSNNLVNAYAAAFPEDFPPGEEGRVKFYSC